MKARDVLLAYGNGWHGADCAGNFGLDAACSCGLAKHIAAIEQEVRDDIRARLEGPVRALHRWDCGRPASEFNEPLAEIVRVLALAAISSSSATETQDGERPGLRTFVLRREADVSGVSGVGDVASGVVFPDGTTVLRWNRAGGSTAVYDSLERMEAIHGHDGRTSVVWLAPTPDDRDREVERTLPPIEWWEVRLGQRNGSDRGMAEFVDAKVREIVAGLRASGGKE